MARMTEQRRARTLPLGLAAALLGLGLMLLPAGQALASWLGFVAMLPLIGRATRAIRPPRWPWAAAPLAHLPVAMLVALAQAAIALAIGRLLGLADASLLVQVRVGLVCYALAVIVLSRGTRRAER